MQDQSISLQDLGRMTPTEALDSFTAAERKLYEPISAHLDKETEHTIESNWKLGKLLADAYQKIHDPASAGAGRGARKRPYGEFFFHRVAIAKGYKTPKLLLNCLRVYDAYQPEKEGDDPKAMIRQYHKLRGPKGQILSWTHIVLLAGVSDLDARLRIARKCLAEGWTTKRLQQYLQPPVEQRRGGGRKNYVPKNFEDALTHIQTSCRAFAGVVENSWFGDEFHIVRFFHNEIPATAVSEDMVQELETAHDYVETLFEKVDDLLSALESVKGDAERMLEEQRQLAQQESPEPVSA